jgi:palmitoyltransferase
LVKGSAGCIQKLLEYGSDRFAKTETGKTPAITAQELNTMGAWQKALKECGYDEDANPIVPTWPGASYFLQDKKGFLNKFLYIWPFLLIWGMITVMAGMPVFVGVPLSLVVGFTMQWVAGRFMEYAPADMRSLQRTPWMSGIFGASLFWVGVNWLFTILPNTSLMAGKSDCYRLGYA